MSNCEKLLKKLNNGDFDRDLSEIYAPDGKEASLEYARMRVERVLNGFKYTFGTENNGGISLFTSPGRTEIGGNHTDHQNGRVICASVNLDILACSASNDVGKIRIKSGKYPMLEVGIDDLEIRPNEKGTSTGLVRGIAAKIKSMGYEIKGFDAYTTSNVPKGSGLSSSAAFEVIVGNFVNYYSCGGKLTPVEIAQIGQYAENVYFGKPCGLMDQMACSVGGAIAIDFKDPANPVLTKIDYDFGRSGHALCIIDTHSGHAKLTDEYAAITDEMKSVAAYFGKNVLREVDAEKFFESRELVKAACGERADLRAYHFFNENERVVKQAESLKRRNFAEFLRLVNESGRSSENYLQNTWSPAHPEETAMKYALEGSRCT